jgi:3-methyl-2-oxobutanoate hydroxymethyltransferase
MSQRPSISAIGARKGKTPIVVLTAYTGPMARLLDPHVDILLVGDSLGMVVYGKDDTLSVTLGNMIQHGAAVVAHSSQALVVIDMPAGTYQESPAQALESASRIMSETGAQAVKLEGGVEMAETIALLVKNGIPVMGHVGLMPQRVHEIGGYRYQGRNEEEANIIMNDALAVEKAGAFAMVIEAVDERVAAAVTKKVSVPTIGIGASPECDGQVLVIDDMLGLTARTPSFVKRYANLSVAVTEAAAAYAKDVRARTFPSAEFCFPLKKKTEKAS